MEGRDGQRIAAGAGHDYVRLPITVVVTVLRSLKSRMRYAMKASVLVSACLLVTFRKMSLGVCGGKHGTLIKEEKGTQICLALVGNPPVDSVNTPTTI